MRCLWDLVSIMCFVFFWTRNPFNLLQIKIRSKLNMHSVGKQEDQKTMEDIRRVVGRYDAALQQVADLTRENRFLRETISKNETKVMRLLQHYQNQIDEQTDVITQLKDERRAQEISQRNARQKLYSDKSTDIGEGDFDSREAELERLIYALEDEIQMLKDNQRSQSEEFERRSIHNQALARKTFAGNIDTLRRMATEAVSNEVADAVSEVLRDNERLSLEFRAVLDEMERLQTSRDAVSKELRRTKRELEFVSYREKLMEERMQSSKMKGIDARADALAAAEESLDCKAASSSLEEYFKESLQLCDNKSKYRA